LTPDPNDILPIKGSNMIRFPLPTNRSLRGLIPAGVLAGALLALPLVRAQQAANPVLQAEAERVAVVEKVKPAVVAVFARGGMGGGSGVLISKDGYALTNFHVVAGPGPIMQCGVPDGVLYDAALVGLDKVGDIALIKLVPKKDGQEFPFAPLGDSDLVREGDWSLAMGNPFLLATDFTPTVTYGLVSGVHRYQYPAGTLLEYTDCIQIDTSINPGNSGGPLFNMKGELIGINGRGSFDKRGRINSGVGYAISVNQIKNFLGSLRAGLDTDHASLGAVVQTQTDKNGLGRMMVTSILEDSDAARRGLDLDDELVSFAGRPVTSVNHLKNVMGLYPRGWRVPIEFRRNEVRKEILVRLMGVQRKTLDESGKPIPTPAPQPMPKPPMPPGQPQPRPKVPGKKPAPDQTPRQPSAADKIYVAKPGFANYYFNKQERDRLLAAFGKHGDFKDLGGTWTIDGTVRLKQLKSESKVKIEIAGNQAQPAVRVQIDQFPYAVEPFKENQEPAELRQPLGSGGLLPALYLWQRLLTKGAGGFEVECDHGGVEPIYPPAPEGKMPASLKELRVDAEVLNTRMGPFLAKWFFGLADQKLLGLEVRLSDNEDPCEVYFADYREVNGRLLPHQMQVVYGNDRYGVFTLKNFRLGAAK
jgi:S1-C subfamily serine protease